MSYWGSQVRVVYLQFPVLHFFIITIAYNSGVVIDYWHYYLSNYLSEKNDSEFMNINNNNQLTNQQVKLLITQLTDDLQSISSFAGVLQYISPDKLVMFTTHM